MPFKKPASLCVQLHAQKEAGIIGGWQERRTVPTGISRCCRDLFTWTLSLYAAKGHTADNVLGKKNVDDQKGNDCYTDHNVHFTQIKFHIVGAS